MLAIANVLRSGGKAALSRAAAGMRVHGWMPSVETDASVLRACCRGRVTVTSCGGEDAAESCMQGCGGERRCVATVARVLR